MREGKASTGWETMLNAAIQAGFQIVGTWPMRTELANRPRSLGSNALASVGRSAAQAADRTLRAG